MATKSEWLDLLKRTPELAQRYRQQRMLRLLAWSAGGSVTAGVLVAAAIMAHHPGARRPGTPGTGNPPDSTVDSDNPGSGSANAPASERVGVYDRADPERMQETQASH